MAEQHRTGDTWDALHGPGGLADMEFAAEYLQLTGSVARGLGSRIRIRRRARPDPMPDLADDFSRATMLWQNLDGFFRMTCADAFDPGLAPADQKGHNRRSLRCRRLQYVASHDRRHCNPRRDPPGRPVGRRGGNRVTGKKGHPVMDIEFRPATAEEMGQFGMLAGYVYGGAYGDGPDNLVASATRPEWTLCAFEGSRLVSSFSTIPFHHAGKRRGLAHRRRLRGGYAARVPAAGPGAVHHDPGILGHARRRATRCSPLGVPGGHLPALRLHNGLRSAQLCCRHRGHPLP